MRITDRDRTWLMVEEWANAQIEVLRTELEHGDSERTRGRILQLRELLALAEPSSAPPQKPPVKYAAS